MVVAVTGNGQLGETTVPVVDSGLVEEGGLERRPLRIWPVQIDAGEVNLGKIESGSRYAGVYKLRLYKSTAQARPKHVLGRWIFPGTISAFLGNGGSFLGASDPFLGTRDAGLGATLLLGTSWPFPGICQGCVTYLPKVAIPTIEIDFLEIQPF